MDDLATLAEQLRTLARHDPNCTVFGANLHGWESEPVDGDEIDAFERDHGVVLPPSYRRWIAEVGVGAGPFYGLDPLPEDGAPGAPFDPSTGDPADGTLTLADQGCGYRDQLVLAGPHVGEIWIDLREAGGPFQRWYPSLEAWLTAWLRRSRAEWLANHLADGLPPRQADPAFVDACRADAEAVLAGSDDPMLGQYPLPLQGLAFAVGALDALAGELERAEQRFEQAAEASSEPAAQRALGACLLGLARDEPAAVVAATDAGLAADGLWASTRLKLLRKRRLALDALDRHDEALETLVAIADAARNDLFAQYDLAWVRLLRGEADLAAQAILGAAEHGVGCDRTAALALRVEQASAGLLQALRGDPDGGEARAEALEAALAARIPAADA
ncbi:MAG: SMI1/KNR4 family protein [Myxococcota bacterium]